MAWTNKALVQLQPPDTLFHCYMSNENEKAGIGAKLDRLTASPGYAFSQLAKALDTASEHNDPTTRERSTEKADKWLQVLSDMLSGVLQVGSRTPVRGIPAWATPEVLTGGFATGKLIAGGPIQPHERSLLKKLSIQSDVTERAVLNSYFLSDAGLHELKEWLRSGLFEINVPEEGALAVVTWLLSKGSTDSIKQLLNEISPQFPKLRFYPAPSKFPVEVNLDSKVFLQDVGTLITKLKDITPSYQVLAQREAITVWLPLYDRMVEILLETVHEDPPTIDPEGAIIGGCPRPVESNEWRAKALEALSQYNKLRKYNCICKRPERKKESFYQVRYYLDLLAKHPDSVKENDLSRVRSLLARYVAKRGVPSSEKWRQIRGKQEKQAKGLTYDKIAMTLVDRLSGFPKRSGFDNIETVVEPLADNNGTQNLIPQYFVKKIQRSLRDTVGSLVKLGVITSGDTLAKVLPQITASVHALAFNDPDLQKLYSSIYRAFRKRRSLLLLNLESQVRLEELPWVAILKNFRSSDSGEKDLAKQCMKEMATITLTSFPYEIIPNKLLQEFHGLSQAAELKIPIVNELAADIFMGKFSDKFLAAAKLAGSLLRGTPYEKYYNLDYDLVLNANDSQESSDGPTTSPTFTRLCTARVPNHGQESFVVRNGMLIEQQQILTTQNLAALFVALDLTSCLKSNLPEMAKGCFSFVCSRQQIKISGRHARLIMKKKTAYAWRQMIFFLSIMETEEQSVLIDWAKEHLAQQTENFRQTFASTLDDLERAVLPTSQESKEVVQPFLGWGSNTMIVLRKIGS